MKIEFHGYGKVCTTASLFFIIRKKKHSTFLAFLQY